MRGRQKKLFQGPYLTSSSLVKVEYRFKLIHVFNSSYQVPYYVVKAQKTFKKLCKVVKHWVNSRTINGHPTFMKAGAMTNWQQIKEDFGVSVATLLDGTNSGQTSIKCSDLSALMEPPPSENCKCLIMKLKFKYLFPTSSSGTNFYIYQLPEGLEIRNILARY